jgi:hypothetical protein
LKALQESLGAIRDGYVLALWLRAQTETATRRGDLALAREARRQAGRFLRASHEHHRTLLGQRPAEGLRRLAPVEAEAARSKEEEEKEKDGSRHRPPRDRP